MQALVVRPHPLAMQPVAYVTRGPIVYCVEDADHPWEQHHFKVTQPARYINWIKREVLRHEIQRTIFDTTAPLREEQRSQPDRYVAIIAESGVAGELDTSAWNRHIAVEPRNAVVGERRNLCFIPYYLRANRGGQGQMRVGLRVI